MKKHVLIGVLLSLSLLVGCTTNGCAANAPPNLTPVGVTAWQNTQVIKGLDLLRDTAITANAQVPPVISTEVTRKVVNYHTSAINTIHAMGTGWQQQVTNGLMEVMRNIPATEQQVLKPYFDLVISVIAEVK